MLSVTRFALCCLFIYLVLKHSLPSKNLPGSLDKSMRFKMSKQSMGSMEFTWSMVSTMFIFHWTNIRHNEIGFIKTLMQDANAPFIFQDFHCAVVAPDAGVPKYQKFWWGKASACLCVCFGLDNFREWSDHPIYGCTRALHAGCETPGVCLL